METVSVQARPAAATRPAGVVRAVASVIAAASAIGFNLIADHVVRLEQFTPADTSGIWWVFGAAAAGWAMLLWLWAVGAVVIDKNRPAEAWLLAPMAVLLTLTPALLTVWLNLWPVVSSTVVHG